MLGLVGSIFLLALDAAPSVSPISFSQGDELNLWPEAVRYQRPKGQTSGVDEQGLVVTQKSVMYCYRS
jgi:hypothetical protein